jgi:hypothetical protein
MSAMDPWMRSSSWIEALTYQSKVHFFFFFFFLSIILCCSRLVLCSSYLPLASFNRNCSEASVIFCRECCGRITLREADEGRKAVHSKLVSPVKTPCSDFVHHSATCSDFVSPVFGFSIGVEMGTMVMRSCIVCDGIYHMCDECL